MIKDEELLEAYNKIRKRVSSLIEKGFDSEPVYNKKKSKSKIKSYDGKINTNFHNNKVQNKGSHCVYLSVILIDSVFKMGKNYYPQVFSEECKYVVKENKMSKFINDQFEISFDKSDYSDDTDNFDDV